MAFGRTVTLSASPYIFAPFERTFFSQHEHVMIHDLILLCITHCGLGTKGPLKGLQVFCFGICLGMFCLSIGIRGLAQVAGSASAPAWVHWDHDFSKTVLHDTHFIAKSRTLLRRIV